MTQTTTNGWAAQRLTTNRVLAGLSVSDLAGRMGVTASRLRRLIAGECPTICEVVRAEMALGLQPGTLLEN
jgi:transcriptional regulator with XRE-family HTH domain